jgi:sulfite oxidase
MIVEPQQGEVVDLVTVRGRAGADNTETIAMKGIAFSGGGKGIVRVECSADGGKSWHEAELTEGADQHPSRAWAWTFWELDVPVSAEMLAAAVRTCEEAKQAGGGEGGSKQCMPQVEIICKATDAQYNSQPESPEPIWNVRGLNNNSWHKVFVGIDLDDE